jgi:hypothetical protein
MRGDGTGLDFVPCVSVVTPVSCVVLRCKVLSCPVLLLSCDVVVVVVVVFVWSFLVLRDVTFLVKVTDCVSLIAPLVSSNMTARSCGNLFKYKCLEKKRHKGNGSSSFQVL